MWDDPRSYSKCPPMIFLMYYLGDTSPFNGSLRVLPGSHRKRHALRDMGVAHVASINQMDNGEDDPCFNSYRGEVDVLIKADDLVICDARIFHASHANRSNERRTVITVWFHPRYYNLLEETRSWIYSGFQRPHANWLINDLAKISRVMPDYEETVNPIKLNRIL